MQATFSTEHQTTLMTPFNVYIVIEIIWKTEYTEKKKLFFLFLSSLALGKV